MHYSIAQTASDRKAILEVLNRQTENWNNGRLEKFMEGYWKSDSLKFIGKNGITYGWQQTLTNYQRNYPDEASRGTLKFEILSIDLLSKDAAFVIGKFFLTRPQKGDANGHFSLLWRRINGQWLIVADHSS
jgi:ketosteroid isomerase-like protein